MSQGTNEKKCPICLDRLSTKKTVVLMGCHHEYCEKCLVDLVLHNSDQDLPILVHCPLCNEAYMVCFHIKEISHPVINLMQDPIDLTKE